MKNSKLLVIAWIVWFLFAFNCADYLIKPFVYCDPDPEIQNYHWESMLRNILIVVSLFTAAGTIALRYFTIVRPYKNGLYNPHHKFGRYFMIGIINWFLANTIGAYGLILFLISDVYLSHLIFGVMGFCLMLYHSPRLGSFVRQEI